jgi:uncharacterized protein (TIGR02145 family)
MRKTIKNIPPLLVACLTLALAFSYSHSSDGKPAIGSFTDARDGKKYKTVKIGEQTWMAENLNYKANGSLCYNHNESYCEKYGRLYDWKTAKKACPSGWHLPSREEWTKLIRFADGTTGEENYYSPTAGKYLKATSGWNSSGNGEDTYDFAALPGGNGSSDGSFYLVGNYGYWWATNESDNKRADIMYIDNSYDSAILSDDYKSGLISVRCVMD